MTDAVSYPADGFALFPDRSVVALRVNGELKDLATVVEYLRTCISVVAVELARGLQMPQEDSGAARLTEALRGADLLLVHLADMPALARRIEHHADFRSRTLSSLRRHRHAVG